MEWEVGQEVYIVPFDSMVRPSFAKIVKISRKWMDVEPAFRGPISKENGCIKPQRGYSPSAKAWPSKEAYDDMGRLDGKWKEFRTSVQYSMPDHISEVDLDLMIGLISGKT